MSRVRGGRFAASAGGEESGTNDQKPRHYRRRQRAGAPDTLR